jgi:hypothetical protein
MGEYPTLETWLGVLGGLEGSHVQFHIVICVRLSRSLA